MTRRALAAALAWAVAAPAQTSGLDRIRRSPDPERRSRQALEFAQVQLDAAIDAYRENDTGGGEAALDLIGDAVELVAESLRSTGKHPRRHPRHFKHAEIRTRQLLEQLRDARRDAHLQDQGDFDDPIERVERANAELLLGIMSPRK